MSGELIKYGMRLRNFPNNKHTWSDLVQFISALPIDSPVLSLIDNENYGWSLTNLLLANIVDSQNWLVWAKTQDAEKKFPKNKPKPIPRPGVTEKELAKNNIGKDLKRSSNAEEINRIFNFKLPTHPIKIEQK